MPPSPLPLLFCLRLLFTSPPYWPLPDPLRQPCTALLMLWPTTPLSHTSTWTWTTRRTTPGQSSFTRLRPPLKYFLWRSYSSSVLQPPSVSLHSWLLCSPTRSHGSSCRSSAPPCCRRRVLSAASARCPGEDAGSALQHRGQRHPQLLPGVPGENVPQLVVTNGFEMPASRTCQCFGNDWIILQFSQKLHHLF